MEHTKKFVLVDTRFVGDNQVSMRDKALSALDSDITNILNSDASDELKGKSYAASLSHFRTYLATPSLPRLPPPPHALPSTLARPSSVKSGRCATPLIRVSISFVKSDRRATGKTYSPYSERRTYALLDDSTLWSRKNHQSKWTTSSEKKNKKKKRRKNKTWFQYI
jgi:hypothetical protein